MAKKSKRNKALQPQADAQPQPQPIADAKPQPIVMVDAKTVTNDQWYEVAKGIVKYWLFWVWFVVILGVTVGIGCFSVVKAISNKIDIRVQSMEDDAVTNMTKRIASVTNRIEGEITKRISEEIKDERITKTISNVVASQAKDLMSSAVEPALKAFTNDLSSFKQSAEGSLTKVKEIADVALLMTRAVNDDRIAYDELVKLREVNSSPFHELAKTVTAEISNNLFQEAHDRQTSMSIWAGTTNSNETASLEDYKILYSQGNPDARMHIVHQFSSNGRLPVYDRFKFLIDVATYERSLKVVNQVCYNLNAHRQTNFTILGMPFHVSWWHENQEKLRQLSQTNAPAADTAPKIIPK